MSSAAHYYTPITKAYTAAASEGQYLDEGAALEITVKTVNNFTGPDSLLHTGIVYGALLRLCFTNNKPTLL